MAAPKVYLSPAMHRANPCVYPRPDGKQCYEALENNEYIDILEPILNRCGIETKRFRIGSRVSMYALFSSAS